MIQDDRAEDEHTPNPFTSVAVVGAPTPTPGIGSVDTAPFENAFASALSTMTGLQQQVDSAGRTQQAIVKRMLVRCL